MTHLAGRVLHGPRRVGAIPHWHGARWARATRDMEVIHDDGAGVGLSLAPMRKRGHTTPRPSAGRPSRRVTANEETPNMPAKKSPAKKKPVVKKRPIRKPAPRRAAAKAP